MKVCTPQEQQLVDNMIEAVGNYVGHVQYHSAVDNGSDPSTVNIDANTVGDAINQFLSNINVIAKERIQSMIQVTKCGEDPNWGYQLKYVLDKVKDGVVKEEDIIGIYVHVMVQTAFGEGITSDFGIIVKPEAVVDSKNPSYVCISTSNTNYEIQDLVDHDAVRHYDPVPATTIMQSMSQELLTWMRTRGIKLYWPEFDINNDTYDTTEELLDALAPCEVVNGSDHIPGEDSST